MKLFLRLLYMAFLITGCLGKTYCQVSSDRNYTSTVDIKEPNITSQAQVNALGIDDKQQSVSYFDGLGRPLQQIAMQASPSGNDIIVPTEFDEYGRETKKFLPYTDQSGTNNGSFRTTMYADQQNYYSAANTNMDVTQQDNFPVIQTFFEFSPLNRPQETGSAGEDWQPGNGHGVQTTFSLNDNTDDVKQFTVTDLPNNDASYTTSEDYGTAQLFKNITIDQAGSSVIEYKDQEGKTILKKVQVADAPVDSYNGWLCTYYVYDDFNRLRLVIPPKAVKWLSVNNWSFSSAGGTLVESELCFRYEYDERHRMTTKKVPGAGWVYMVYDKRDRLIYTQDANMRALGQWLYTLYDAINRPVQTGMIGGSNITQAYLQGYVNGLDYTTVNNALVNGSLTTAVPTVLTVTQVDPHRTLYEATTEIDLDGDIYFDPATLSTPDGIITLDIVAANSNNFTGAQTINANPIPVSGNGTTIATPIPLTLTYYDDYSWTNKTYDNANIGLLDKGTNIYAEPLPTQQVSLTIGMVTGTRIRAIENAGDLTQGNWLDDALFYDEKGRSIQTQHTNYKGGLDETTMLYSFINQVLCTYAVNNNPSGNVYNLAVKTNMNYDRMGRLLTITKEINSDPTTLRTITQNTYNELGQLKNKKLGQKKNTDGSLSSDPMENQVYNYNIQGWLKGINWDYSSNTSLATSVTGGQTWFSMDLGYNNGYNTNQFNGNIAGMSWQSGGDQQERKYDYNYDRANRLLAADFNQNFSGTWSKNNGDLNIDFSVQMGDGQTASSAYDENGNILAMKQYGLGLNNSSVIDDLHYTYMANSNKLQNVVDFVNDPSSTLGDFKTGQQHPQYNYKSSINDIATYNANASAIVDYKYDDNGNLTVDNNKGIMPGTVVISDQIEFTPSILYNYLNLPWQIPVTGKGTITYIYDATGNKLEKRTNEQPSTSNNNQNIQTTTTYIGGFVYQNNALQFFAQEEGRIRLKTATVNNCAPSTTQQYVYDYFIKDHLGNIRTVLTDEQKTDIYPAATLEDGSVATEANYYNINTGNIVANPAALSSQTYQNNNGFCNPGDNNATALSQKMYDLNASGSQPATGLGITLKVMAGDVINIYGNSFYTQNDPNPSADNVSTPLAILGSLLTTPVAQAATAAHGGATATQLLTGNNVNPADGGLPVFLNNNNTPTTPSAPTASINYIIFDDHFQFVSGGVSKVTEPFNGQLQPHNDLQNISVPKNGYIYVYCSNASPVDVYFDNLQVTQQHGPLVQDNAYSPWGLQLQGISSSAVCIGDAKTQRYKYNGDELQSSEFSDGSGLDIYDTHFRNLDQQLGRWWQIDPLSSLFDDQSPYDFVVNNPSRFEDPLGLGKTDWVEKKNGKVVFDKNVHSDDQAKATYGKGAKDLGAETDQLYDNKSGQQVHGNADGTTSMVTLPDAVVTTKAKGEASPTNGGFYWSNTSVSDDQYYSAIGSVRDEHNGIATNLSPANMAHLNSNRSYYENAWKAEQDWRKMQLGAVGIFGGPILMEAGIPLAIEGAGLAADGLTAASGYVSDAALNGLTYLNAGKDIAINYLGGAIVQYGPESMIFSPTLFRLTGYGYGATITGETIYKAVNMVLDKTHVYPEGFVEPEY